MSRKVVKFYADWCGPCRMYDVIWKRVTPEFENVEFESINIETDTTGAAAEYNIRSIPHTTLIREDGTVEHKTGQMKDADLREFINS